MPRTAHPMTSISTAMAQLRHALEGLVAEQALLRRELQSTLQQRLSARRNGLSAGRNGVSAYAGPKKRGRAFKFSDAQAAEFRKQVEGGKSTVELAKELKISLPTMYSTLKRVGWKPRQGRPASRPTRAAHSSGPSSGPKKRGRAFKFSADQAADFRKQVEDGKSARALAKDLKVSLPTMYNTLRRAGWKGRPGRKARAA